MKTAEKRSILSRVDTLKQTIIHECVEGDKKSYCALLNEVDGQTVRDTVPGSEHSQLGAYLYVVGDTLNMEDSKLCDKELETVTGYKSFMLENLTTMDTPVYRGIPFHRVTNPKGDLPETREETLRFIIQNIHTIIGESRWRFCSQSLGVSFSFSTGMVRALNTSVFWEVGEQISKTPLGCILVFEGREGYQIRGDIEKITLEDDTNEFGVVLPPYEGESTVSVVFSREGIPVIFITPKE